MGLQVSRRVQRLGIISVILIVVASYGLFFYFQSKTEGNIQNSLFDQQKQRQLEATKSISQHITSDLDSVMGRLEGIANSADLRNGLVSNDNTKRLLEQNYQRMDSIVDTLFVLDKNSIVKIILVPPGERNFVGSNFSYLNWIKQTLMQHKPVTSDGYVGFDGKYRIGLAYPIVNRETGQIMGIIGAAAPTQSLFANYGNIHNVNSQFLVIYDKNATVLAAGASKTLVGRNFFGEYTQKFINHNPILNNLTRNLLNGNPGLALYNYGKGERLTTQYPIFINGVPTYFIQVVTPTASIYSQVTFVLSTQRLETFILLAATTAAVIVFMVFLVKWNRTLDDEVKRRTNELDESIKNLAVANQQLAVANEQLSIANEQLTVHDKMQEEFINVASHEIKTPTQVILGYSELLLAEPEKYKDMVPVIHRSASRLQKLTNDILDVTRIESHSLKLNKEKFNLTELICNIVEDVRNHIQNKGSCAVVMYEPKDNIVIAADKGRITQVVSNLLNNAIRFTRESNIDVHVVQEQKEVVVTVKDTGTGIDSEILPRLFTKFTTSKSSLGGTGLGLFISNSIIEAHGGRMWAENNTHGKGAKFAFSIPL
jgi:signal transduction histidine kinase